MAGAAYTLTRSGGGWRQVRREETGQTGPMRARDARAIGRPHRIDSLAQRFDPQAHLRSTGAAPRFRGV